MNIKNFLNCIDSFRRLGILIKSEPNQLEINSFPWGKVLCYVMAPHWKLFIFGVATGHGVCAEPGNAVLVVSAGKNSAVLIRDRNEPSGGGVIVGVGTINSVSYEVAKDKPKQDGLSGFPGQAG